jgi:hypothetical protein
MHYFGCDLFILDVDYRLDNFNFIPTTLGYKVEVKVHLVVRGQKRLNITVLEGRQTPKAATLDNLHTRGAVATKREYTRSCGLL